MRTATLLLVSGTPALAFNSWTPPLPRRALPVRRSASATEPPKVVVPDLPADSLVIASPDEPTWLLEKKEHAALLSEEDAPTSFAPLIESFELQGTHYLAFENVGGSLSSTKLSDILLKDDGVSPLPTPVADAVRLTLVRDLLDAIHWCHLQGLPHMGLSGSSCRIYKKQPQGAQKRAYWRLAVVGMGAGPQIATRETVFQLNNESWPFNPPETMTGGLLQGNLPGFYKWDAWSVGVLLTMLIGGDNVSPFDASVDISKLTFSQQAAVGKRIKKTFEDGSEFLTELNARSGGFLFRHGWLVELVLGLLKEDPDKRMSTTTAWEIMQASAPNPGANKKRAAPKASAGGPILGQGPMTQDQKRKLRVAFNAFDTDRSGDISVDEIVGALDRVGVTVTVDQASAMVKSVDEDGDGLIDFGEFCAMMKDLPATDNPGDAKAVFGSRFTSSQGEPFRALESMIAIADKGLCEVAIQDRTEASYGTSLKNYGEIVGFRNRADGDRWDIVVPGLGDQLPAGSRHRLSAVLGVIMIKGGNHKLVVALGGSRPDPDAVSDDIKSFIDDYSKSHPDQSKSRMRYMQLDDPYSPAGTIDREKLLEEVGGLVPEDGESWLSSTYK